jgi:hypothetical protein
MDYMCTARVHVEWRDTHDFVTSSPVGLHYWGVWRAGALGAIIFRNAAAREGSMQRKSMRV